MHKSLNRMFKTLKEHNISANSGIHLAEYHKTRMKSLLRPQKTTQPQSPLLPISMSHDGRKAYVCCKVLFQKSKS